MSRIRVEIILGTRPEVIKMAPVVEALRQRPDTFAVTVVSTGQHRQLLDQALKPFGLQADEDLRLMRPNQDLADLTCAAISALSARFRVNKPDLLLVQGDTTTVLSASLAAFYQGVAVGHVEAGLRSHDIRNPFPEEVNRKLTSVVTRLHFAPTMGSRAELLREGYLKDSIVVTGNTVVDALLRLAGDATGFAGTPLEGLGLEGKRLLLVTSHRRESFDGGLREICLALRDIAEAFPDVAMVYPMHLNPKVREVALGTLGGTPRVHLVEPLDYPLFVRLMRAAHLILTDSGGVQEEAPTFDVPVLVMRQVTERPEAFARGQALVVGTNRQGIVAQTSRLLADPAARAAMTGKGNPFGDGQAAQRIADAIEGWAAGNNPILPMDRQFAG